MSSPEKFSTKILSAEGTAIANCWDGEVRADFGRLLGMYAEGRVTEPNGKVVGSFNGGNIFNPSGEKVGSYRGGSLTDRNGAEVGLYTGDEGGAAAAFLLLPDSFIR